MKVLKTRLAGLLLVETKPHRDERGFFLETYHAERYAAAGIPARFVQTNFARSRKGVLRGLHYQLGRPQAKLVQVLKGKVFAVAVDLRAGSPTFGCWEGVTLSSRSHLQLYIPEGFAHGYCVVSDSADCFYQCTDYYAPEEERGIRWDDPDLAIDWPEGERLVSPRDWSLPFLRDMPGELPK
jgi:dTDP-4-dehydrorhamnose 3,5-epimerase